MPAVDARLIRQVDEHSSAITVIALVSEETLEGVE
jgi:hypothetical protein